MTADDWDRNDDPGAMVRAVGDRVSNRRWRLFMAAAVRDARRHHLVPKVVDSCKLAERFADGLVDRQTIVSAHAHIYDGWSQSELPALLTTGTRLAGTAWTACLSLDRVDGEPARRAGWLREVLGNPFRWVRWEDEWATPTVHTLATVAYSRGLFADLPVLTDAAEDAGCDNPELLAHLRGAGPHCRGCWALDVVLGKV